MLNQVESMRQKDGRARIKYSRQKRERQRERRRGESLSDHVRELRTHTVGERERVVKGSTREGDVKTWAHTGTGRQEWGGVGREGEGVYYVTSYSAWDLEIKVGRKVGKRKKERGERKRERERGNRLLRA